MAKVKNKRNSGLADRVHNKKQGGVQKKINPFEVHINREKFKVIGQKSKHDRGLPGVARAKSLQKRKETLGAEMKLLNKTNTFIDKRIGEKDTNLTPEEKIMARFAAEKARAHHIKTGKKSIFNLADDEVLTHRGQTLEEIEKFDDPRSSDDEDNDGRKFGGLTDEFVSEVHFGGGMLSKTENKDGARSHKDIIEQLIAESKKRKAEKQKVKEQTLDLTEKLDTEWKDLRPIVFKRPRVETNDDEPSLIDKLLIRDDKRNEDYDKMMRELRFEARGTPSDALKSEEQIAKEQKQKLEQLEKDRLERMHGVYKGNTNSSNKHRSADDLDDNFDLDNETNIMVAYDKDGNPLIPEHVLKDNAVIRQKAVKFDREESDDENVSDDDSSDEEDDESEVDSLNDLKDSDQSDNDGEGQETDTNEELNDSLVKAKASKSGNERSTGENEEETSEPQVKKSKNENKLDKINHGSFNSKGLETSENEVVNREVISESVNSVPQQKINESTKSGSIKLKTDLMKVNDESFNGEMIDKSISERIKAELLNCKHVMERAMNELPYTYDMPNRYEDLEELLKDKEPEYQSVILERLIKCHHPSLAEKNKENLSLIFAYMLQYINNIFTELKTEEQVKKSFRTFDRISPLMYDLAQYYIMNAKKYLTEVLIEKYQDYKKQHKIVPDLDTIIFFKLISIIFPTSDFRHPVVTPSLVFMAEILRKCKFNNAYSISRGFLITSLVLEYTTLSKRFVPSAINFIRGILFMSAPTTVLNPVSLVPPFKFYCNEANLLVLEEDETDLTIETKMTCHELTTDKIDKSFKIKTLVAAVDMLKEMYTNCSELDAQEFMFKSHLMLMNRIEFDLYPSDVSKKCKDTLRYIKESLEVRTYSPLAREKPKPKALKLYEPDVQDVFTGTKSSKLSREQVERKKLVYKHKKEMKGALREIRRDKTFIAGVKIREKIHSDNIRKEKVKQIYKDASIQQGELNKMQRKRK